MGMSTTADEIYSKTIRCLPNKEKLEIASIILDEVTGRDRVPRSTAAQDDMSKLFGIFTTCEPDGSDNERIDLDLTSAYSDENEGKN